MRPVLLLLFLVSKMAEFALRQSEHLKRRFGVNFLPASAPIGGYFFASTQTAIKGACVCVGSANKHRKCKCRCWKQ